MKQDLEERKRRMNEGLCPEDFEICVPRDCRLLKDWKKPTKWEEYLKELVGDDELPLGYVATEDGVKTAEGESSCCTCEGKEAWRLRGELAIRHACRVHDRLHRQALSLEQVNAVDVGFAIQERQTRFHNFLAIRIHVNKKLPPEQLVRAGLASFTLPAHAFARESSGRPGLAYLISPARQGQPTGSPPQEPCEVPPSRRRHLRRILKSAHFLEKVWKNLGRYPLAGISREDLSLFCPEELTESSTLDDLRLCICGVPIDIVNASYNPSVTHPGGDADSGVFVDPPRRSDQLSDEEHLLIGRGRVNPMVGGVSVGSITGQAGTLGAVVWDRTDGTPCVLSNWHVLAGTATAQVGQPTYQPALFDGGTENDVVAHLKRWHLGEKGDAAIAELAGARHYASGEVLGLWHPVSGYLPPKLNMEIRKWGRTTGFTEGFIDGIHLATNIDYGNGVVRYFRDQIHIASLIEGENVSQVGDSGSLVVTSFQPLQMQKDVAQLCKWLRACCDSKGVELLCAEIPCVLTELQEKCSKHIGYQDLCEILEEWVPPSPPSSCSMEELEEFIIKALESLSGYCLALEKQIELYLKIRDVLEVKLEECNGALVPDLGELEKSCQVAVECLSTEHRDEIQEGIESPCDVCDWVEHCLGFVENKLRSLRKCSEFCRCVEATFQGWKVRFERIAEGEKLIKKICVLLEAKCKGSECKDASQLVRCVEDGLRCFETGYRNCDDYDQVKCVAEELLGEKEKAGGQNRSAHEENFDTKFLAEIKKIGFDPEVEREKGEDWFLQALKKDLQDNAPNASDWFVQVLKKNLTKEKLLRAVIDQAKQYLTRRNVNEAREETRVYFAVGMIFAGDTPGSPFGEFAVASDISGLANELRFSLRPVFEPRSSFRELRVRPQRQLATGRAFRSRRGLSPGDQGSDPRGGGPQPDLEPSQGDPGGGRT